MAEEMSATERSANTLGKPLPVYILRGIPETSSSVTAVCLETIDSKDYLICGTDCGHLLLWSLDTYRCQSVVNTGHNSRVQHLIAADDHVLCQSKNGVIDAYDRRLSCVQKSWTASDITFCKCFLYLSPNTDNTFRTKYLGFVSKRDNKLIEIIDYKSDECVVTVGQTEANNGCPLTLFVTPFDSMDTKFDVILVIIGFESGSVVVFKADPNANQSQCVAQLKCFETMITAMDFNAEKMCGICCSVDDVISVWTMNTSEDKSDICLSLKKELKIATKGLLSCGIRSDGRIFVCGGTDGRIRLFAMKSLKPLAIIEAHKESAECLAFSHKLVTKQNAILLAVGSKDKTISLWDFYNNI